ncbi:ATP-binding cassette domain-containing protein [Salmonella enterica subsp. enterica]|nr:ATP-binding cassette domain-containing protein [Salmonella enterica subsp. enterica]
MAYCITIALSSTTCWRVNPGEHWQIVGPNGGAGKSTLLSLLLAIIRKATATILRCSGGGEEAAKQSGISKHIGYQQQFTSGLPRRVTVRAMSSSPAISILSAFTVPFQTGNENWRNSGWIFWESISVRRMPPSTVSPGTAAAGADRARAG